MRRYGILLIQENQPIFTDQEKTRHTLQPEQPMVIHLASHWLTGIYGPLYGETTETIEEHRFECDDGSFCGLVAGMLVGVDEERKKHEWNYN